MANALAGFFAGMEAGSKFLSNSSDNASRRVKEQISIEGLDNALAEEQVLQADRMRNAKAQYDFDTANRSANLDSLYRTHDGVVDATVAKNRFNTALYDNEKAGEDLYGLSRNDARLSNYDFNKVYDDNRTAGIEMYGKPKNELELAKVNLGLGDYGIKQKVQDATSNIQYLTGITNENEQYLGAQDKYYDAETGLLINPDQRTTTVNLAGADVSNSEVKNVSAAQTIQPRIATNVNTAQSGLLDSKTGVINSETGLTTTAQGQPYKIRTALSNAQLETLTSEDQTAVALVQSMVSGVPEEMQDSVLQEIAISSPDNKQRLAAQRLLNSRAQQIQTQQQTLTEKFTLQVAPAQALANKGFNVEPLEDGTYNINGEVYTEPQVATIANNVLGSGDKDNPLAEIQEKGKIDRQNDALKAYQDLYTKLSEDGISEVEQKAIDKAKADFMVSTGMPVSPAPSAPTPTEGFTMPIGQITGAGMQVGLWYADENNNPVVPDGNGGRRALSGKEVIERWNNYIGKPNGSQ